MKPYKTLLFLVGFLFIGYLVVRFSPIRHWDILSFAEIKLPGSFLPKTANSSFENKEKTDVFFSKPVLIKPEIREYPNGQNIKASLFYKDSNFPHPLSSFYESLTLKKAEDKCLRILHFGDSQIETDHISKMLRECLQYSFGGSGKGFLNIFNPHADGQYQISLSKEWKKMEMRNAQRKGNFGPYNAYLYVPPFGKPKTSASLHIKLSKKTEISPSYPLILSILCHEDLHPEEVELCIDKVPMRIFSQTNLFGLRRIDYQIPQSFNEIQFNVLFGKNHFLYAVLMNENKGICVDNIPLRGNSGRIFLQNNRQFLETSYQLLDVDLVIFQFGVNAIPQDSKQVMDNFDYYEKILYLELSYLHSIMPKLPILVIGTSDRTRRQNGLMESNPNIFLIREAQKNAALKAGCAYWDLFEAMGGSNSMQKWVEGNPALANKDYTHFNKAGSDKVAKMLYKSLLADYTQYFMEKQEVKHE